TPQLGESSLKKGLKHSSRHALKPSGNSDQDQVRSEEAFGPGKRQSPKPPDSNQAGQVELAA
ncbi:MAG: hypothetical protein KGQ59_11290, partial [Bdellovibrionales bacterium]|nr:hypothetical protein [Bdellovibrionales bacterium]